MVSAIRYRARDHDCAHVGGACDNPEIVEAQPPLARSLGPWVRLVTSTGTHTRGLHCPHSLKSKNATDMTHSRLYAAAQPLLTLSDATVTVGRPFQTRDLAQRERYNSSGKQGDARHPL